MRLFCVAFRAARRRPQSKILAQFAARTRAVAGQEHASGFQVWVDGASSFGGNESGGHGGLHRLRWGGVVGGVVRGKVEN